MLSNIVISWNIVAPMLLYGITGFVINKAKLIPEAVYPSLNTLYYHILLPCMLFYNICGSDMSDFGGKLYIFAAVTLVISFLAFMFIVPLIEKDDNDRGVIVQGLMRGNTTVYGMPLALGLLGGSAPADVLVLLGLVVVFNNVLSPLVFSRFSGHKSDVKTILKGVVTNPLIIAGALGVAVSLLHITLPSFVLSSIKGLGGAATPLAFISLGATFKADFTPEYRKKLLWILMVRLVVVPVIWIGVGAYVFGLRGACVAALLAIFATPPAVSTYPTAHIFGANERLAGDLVIFGTLVSIGTLFLLIFFAKTLGLA